MDFLLLLAKIMDWEALSLSVRLAASTTVLLMLLVIPLAYFLVASRSRWQGLIQAVISLPLVLPPTVLGFYLLRILGTVASGSTLAFSFSGLLVGSLVYSLPFAFQPVYTAVAELDRRWIEAAWCLGVSRWDTFRRVVLPLSLPGILSGMILTFAHTLGEFGIVLMMGGNIPGVTRTISIAIYDEVQQFHYAEAERISFFLLAFAWVALLCVGFLQRKGSRIK